MVVNHLLTGMILQVLVILRDFPENITVLHEVWVGVIFHDPPEQNNSVFWGAPKGLLDQQSCLFFLTVLGLVMSSHEKWSHFTYPQWAGDLRCPNSARGREVAGKKKWS